MAKKKPKSAVITITETYLPEGKVERNVRAVGFESKTEILAALVLTTNNLIQDIQK